jgi:chromosomal replication initiation ATPase DnaA
MVAVFGVPNEFVLTQTKKFFAKSLKESINAIYNPQFSIKFIIYAPFASNHHPLLLDLKKLLRVKDVKDIELTAEKKTFKREMSEFFGILFDPKFTFDTFVV